MACRTTPAASCIGYAATDRPPHLLPLPRRRAWSCSTPEAPDEALEDVAFGFVEEWIWYDEEEAALERVRYAGYGYPVRGANLRSEKLAAAARAAAGATRRSTRGARGARSD